MRRSRIPLLRSRIRRRRIQRIRIPRIRIPQNQIPLIRIPRIRIPRIRIPRIRITRIRIPRIRCRLRRCVRCCAVLWRFCAVLRAASHAAMCRAVSCHASVSRIRSRGFGLAELVLRNGARIRFRVRRRVPCCAALWRAVPCGAARFCAAPCHFAPCCVRRRVQRCASTCSG